MIQKCPGSSNIKGTPDLKIKKCPNCGNEIELFSTDMKVNCGQCNFVAYNDSQSCIKWCAYARECVGDEIYEIFIKNQMPIMAEKKSQ